MIRRQALSQDIHLGLAEVAFSKLDLSLQIRPLNDIIIPDFDLPDACSRQEHCAWPAERPCPDNGYRRRAQLLDAGSAYFLQHDVALVPGEVFRAEAHCPAFFWRIAVEEIGSSGAGR